MTLNALIKPFVLAASLILPVAASATPVSLTYNGGTSSGWVQITDAPSGVPAQSLPWNVGAFGFNMTDSTGNLGDSAGRFVAWCLDISHYLGGQGVARPYETTTTPFTNSYAVGAQLSRIQAVFDANFASVTLDNVLQAAGFQVALWNALYDNDWSVTDTPGTFDAADGTSGVAAQANIYLAAAALDNSATRAWNLTFLQSTGNPVNQNLVTATPVPLPAAGVLLLAALGGLGLMRRRKAA